ncbi:MAG: hypothetical protein ACLFTK_13530 [Anaerolineales bacterium]
MIRRISHEILERLLRGELDYERDLRTLRHHLALAKEFSDLSLAGQLEFTLGFAENEIGNVGSAESYWRAAYHTYERLGDMSGMAGVQNHLGELYFRLSNHAKALAAYLHARELAEQIGDTEIINRVEGNLGFLWLAEDKLLDAQICFSLVVAVTQYETWQHIYSLISAHRGLAEVYRAMGRFDDAWREVREAHFLAEGRGLKLPLAQTYITKAHIAQDSAQPADEFYTQGRALVRAYGNPLILAQMLVSEARYQHGKHRPDQARALAMEARELVAKLGLADAIRRIDAVLAGFDEA